MIASLRRAPESGRKHFGENLRQAGTTIANQNVPPQGAVTAPYIYAQRGSPKLGPPLG